MAATIVGFPHGESHDHNAQGCYRAGRRIYTFGHMVRIAGLSHVETRTAISTLRDMVRRSGLPAPITTRRFAGQVYRHCPEAVEKRAWWDAAEVDHWSRGDDPSGDALSIPRPRDLGEHLRRRAQLLAV